MKKRMLSIALCLCMALTLLPTAALAASTPDVKVDDKCIFANGVPITIEAGASGKTKIKAGDGYLDLAPQMEGTQTEADLSAWTIYGGSKDANVSSSSITMTGGTVAVIFGGGWCSSNTATAETESVSISLKNAVIAATAGSPGISGNVYGGGNGTEGPAKVGTATIHIENTKVEQVVYGGGRDAAVDTVQLNMQGRGEAKYVFAGSEYNSNSDCVVTTANVIIGNGWSIANGFYGGQTGSSNKVTTLNGIILAIGGPAQQFQGGNLLYRASGMDFKTTGNVSIPEDVAISLADGSTLEVCVGSQLTVLGSLQTAGKILNYGKIIGRDKITGTIITLPTVDIANQRIYANGMPILIQGSGNPELSSVNYPSLEGDGSWESLILNLDPGAQNEAYTDLRTWTIYGGSLDETVASTSIRLENYAQVGTIYGGGHGVRHDANVTGSATIFSNSGKVGTVYAGGHAEGSNATVATATILELWKLESNFIEKVSGIGNAENGDATVGSSSGIFGIKYTIQEDEAATFDNILYNTKDSLWTMKGNITVPKEFDLKVLGGQTLTIPTGSTLQVDGNLRVSGTLTVDGTFCFNGTSFDSYSGNGTLTGEGKCITTTISDQILNATSNSVRPVRTIAEQPYSENLSLKISDVKISIFDKPFEVQLRADEAYAISIADGDSGVLSKKATLTNTKTSEQLVVPFTVTPAAAKGMVTIDHADTNTDGKLNEGDTLTANTSAITPAGGTPSYQWKKNVGGAVTDLGTDAAYTLTLGDTTGKIFCEVTLSGVVAGTITSNSVEIAKQPLKGSITLSGDPTLGSALTVSLPTNAGLLTSDYTIMWYRNETPIQGASAATYTVAKDDVGKSLKVVITAAETSQNYTGALTSAVLIPATAPEAPVITAAAGDSKVTVSWAAPFDGGSAITGYTLTITPTVGGSPITVAPVATSYEVTGLDNNTTYTFTLTATNAVGSSAISNTETATPSDIRTVTFNTNGGSDITPIQVANGGTITTLTPSKSGYDFGGWYTDAGLTAAFDQTVPITADCTLYAKWTERQSSSSGGGSTTPSVTVPVSSDEGKVSVSASVSGGTATITVTDKQLAEIASNAADTGTVTVDLSGLKNVDSAKIPAKIVAAANTAPAPRAWRLSCPPAR